MQDDGNCFELNLKNKYPNLKSNGLAVGKYIPGR